MAEGSSFWSRLSNFVRGFAGFIFPSIPDASGKRGQWAQRVGRISLLLGFFAILAYSAQWDRFTFLKVVSLGLLVGLAGLLFGVLMGFLFGIPRTLQQMAPTLPGTPTQEAAEDAQNASLPAYLGNTNLEQISDWLTKILVGVTLTQFGPIRDFMKQLVSYLSRGLGNEPGHQPFIFALLVFFPICGFLLGYLLTRLYLPPALRQSDIETRRISFSLVRIDKQVEQVLERNVVSREASAQLDADPALRTVTREQIRVLADEYERLRETMPSGNDRTRSMELVATQMRTLANLGKRLVPELVKYPSSPGERLAAIAFLQVHPDLDYLDWLAEHVAEEQPFIGYHAAVALLYAARSFGRQAIDAIRKAKRSLGSAFAGTDRWKVLEQAEQAAIA